MKVFDAIYFRLFKKHYIDRKILPKVEQIKYKYDLNAYWVKERLWIGERTLLSGDETFAVAHWRPSGEFVVSIRAQTPYTDRLKEAVQEILSSLPYRSEEFRIKGEVIWHDFIL